ncbi:MAG: hypothetical protein ACXWC6_14640 [Ramlibacter sp.]
MHSKTKTKTTLSLLLAGLLGAAGAWAETPPTATSDLPVGGQASTMSHGAPNMATTNNPAVENPAPVGTMGAAEPMASDASSTNALGAGPAPAPATAPDSYGSSHSAVVENPPATGTAGAAAAPNGGRYSRDTSSSQTMDVPVRGGEVSTMTQGRPNASTNNFTPDGSVTDMRVARAYPDVRMGTGEASTVVNGQPNANPDDPLINKSRMERRTERELSRAEARTRREEARMGQGAYAQ